MYLRLNAYTINFLDKNYVYTRLELVDKDDLLTSSDKLRLGITQDQPSFRIRSYTFGGARGLGNNEKISFAVCSGVTSYSKPATLDISDGNNPDH